MKKFCAILLTIVMLLSLNTPVLAVNDTATQTISEEQMDENLLSRGYPQQLLNHMVYPAKLSLFNMPDLVFESGIILTYNMETTESNEYIFSEGVMPYGQIDDEDLTLSWAYSRDVNDATILHVRFSYDWDRMPIARFQDAVSISWDPEIYEYVLDSFYKADMYDGTQFHIPVTNQIHDSSRSFSSASEYGFTWHADLCGYLINASAYKLYGYGEFALKKISPNEGTTRIYGHYAHQTLGAISVTIPQIGAFNVSGVSYDELASIHTIPY